MGISFNISKLEAIIAPGSILNNNFSKLNKFIYEPDLSHIKALQRRRLSTSARMVFSILKNFELGNTPIIFSSKYGEIDRAYNLLNDLAKNEDISPTSFSLSVHNAISALHSIFAKNEAEICAISSQNSLEYAFLNAYLKLQEGHQKALVISHFKGAKSEFINENLDYAVGILLEKGNDFKLDFIPNNSKIAMSHSSLEFLNNYENKKGSWEIEDINFRWIYTCE